MGLLLRFRDDLRKKSLHKQSPDGLDTLVIFSNVAPLITELFQEIKYSNVGAI